MEEGTEERKAVTRKDPTRDTVRRQKSPWISKFIYKFNLLVSCILSERAQPIVAADLSRARQHFQILTPSPPSRWIAAVQNFLEYLLELYPDNEQVRRLRTEWMRDKAVYQTTLLSTLSKTTQEGILTDVYNAMLDSCERTVCTLCHLELDDRLNRTPHCCWLSASYSSITEHWLSLL